MPNHDDSVIPWIRDRTGLVDRINQMPGPRNREPGANHFIEKNRDIGAQNQDTKLEELSLEPFLIRSSATSHGSNGVINARRGEQVAERRQNGVDRRLLRDVIKSRGVRGKGAS